MRFAELSDKQWVFIKSYGPPQPIVGRKSADNRKTINGILHILTAGCRRQDMPPRYGAYQTIWRRLDRWSKEGVWIRIPASAQEPAYAIGKLKPKTVAIDSLLINSKKGGESERYNRRKRLDGVKVHAVVSSGFYPACNNYR